MEVSVPKARTTESPASQVRAYFGEATPESRRVLKSIRKAILDVAPGAEEAFSYGIPGFRLQGRPLVWYAAFKAHASLYPMTAAIRKTYAEDLKGLKGSTGTVQFPLGAPLPIGLVKKLVKARVAEARAAALRGRQARGKR